jgi:hypothetical protein
MARIPDLRSMGEKTVEASKAVPGPAGDAMRGVGEALMNWPPDVPVPAEIVDLLAGEAGKWVPVSPARALKQVAEAVVAAEDILGGAGLGVASGRVEVSLVVDVGGTAGAQATFHLTFGPVTGT